MHFVEVGAFEVLHEHLAWPWIAIDPKRTRLAFVDAKGHVATRVLEGAELAVGPSFELPKDIALPTKKPPVTGHRGAEKGIHAFAIDADATLLALTATVNGESFVVTLDASGEKIRSRVDALAGVSAASPSTSFVAHAITFDRTGKRLWISAENEKATALILIDARTHEVFGALESRALPPPAFHELHVHPQDDAVLLLAACGQDGTFARVAGFTDGPPVAIPTALDDGSVSAGFVGFSSDGARVHIVEADELRTHAWPGLEELSSVELADDFASSYAGAVLGHRIFVDGEDRETGDGDAVMLFDRSALRGVVVKAPVPTGMWVGRVGADAIVTVESKGDPAHARVLRLPPPQD